jgi:hypothetical protein
MSGFSEWNDSIAPRGQVRQKDVSQAAIIAEIHYVTIEHIQTGYLRARAAWELSWELERKSPLKAGWQSQATVQRGMRIFWPG